MKCGHCGAADPNIYLSETYHADYGLIQEWACNKCGSRDIEGVPGMAKKGTCENCGRENLSLFKATGTDQMFCSTCRNVTTVYPPGPDRDKALTETKERLQNKDRKPEKKKEPFDCRRPWDAPTPKIVDAGTMADEEESTLGAGNPPPSSPPPPLKEDADFPVIVLSFSTERDRTLYHAIRGNAASARNEKMDQHVLHLLEKALSLSA